MMTEDLTTFFDTDEFAVAASFTPAGGGAAETANVLLNSPTDELLGGQVLSDNYEITYRAVDLPSIKQGDSGTVDGVAYRIREVRMLDDGKIKAATLVKS